MVKPILRRYDYVIQRLLTALLLKGWRARKDADPVAGDLVMLQSAPQGDWHLSLFLEGKDDGIYLLESLKTGETSWWTNVGFSVLDTEACGIDERAVWTDAQFDFADKLRKVSIKADFYINLPFIDHFDGDSVVIKFRTRHAINDKLTELPPMPYRKMTQKRLMQALLAGERLHAPPGGSDA